MTENKENVMKIDLDKVKKYKKLNKVIYVRTTEEICQWMNENNISPRALFNEAAKSLMKSSK